MTATNYSFDKTAGGIVDSWIKDAYHSFLIYTTSIVK